MSMPANFRAALYDVLPSRARGVLNTEVYTLDDDGAPCLATLGDTIWFMYCCDDPQQREQDIADLLSRFSLPYKHATDLLATFTTDGLSTDDQDFDRRSQELLKEWELLREGERQSEQVDCKTLRQLVENARPGYPGQRLTITTMVNHLGQCNSSSLQATSSAGLHTSTGCDVPPHETMDVVTGETTMLNDLPNPAGGVIAPGTRSVDTVFNATGSLFVNWQTDSSGYPIPSEATQNQLASLKVRPSCLKNLQGGRKSSRRSRRWYNNVPLTVENGDSYDTTCYWNMETNLEAFRLLHGGKNEWEKEFIRVYPVLRLDRSHDSIA